MIQFNEKYDVLQRIGTGGSSCVFLVQDRYLHKKWAAKMVAKSALMGQLNEVQILKQLDFPGLPRIVEVCDTFDSLWIIMDYIPGKTLQQMVFQYGIVTETTAVTWMLELLEMLSYLHQLEPPVIFCDLKPENVMLKPDGRLALIDFGIARQADMHAEGWGTNPSQICMGTPGFAAPEQFLPQGVCDARTDIYSAGVLLGFLLTGISPTLAKSFLAQLSSKHKKGLLSRKMRQIIGICLQEDPQKRFQDTAQLIAALQRLKG